MANNFLVFSGPSKYHVVSTPAIYKIHIHYPIRYTVSVRVKWAGKEQHVLSTVSTIVDGRAEASFELTGFFKGLLAEQNFNADNLSFESEMLADKRLAMYCTINIGLHHETGLLIESEDYPLCIVNAVTQCGETPSLDPPLGASSGKILTERKVFPFYEGFPVDITILGPPGYEYQAVRFKLDRWTDPLYDSTGNYIADRRGNRLYAATVNDSVPVQVAYSDVPPQPFWVRWINRFGGIDYQMFSMSQKYEKTVSGIETIKLHNGRTINGSDRAFWAESKHSVTVGAENLDENEFDILSGIPFSPWIEYYEPVKKKWFRLIPSKSSAECDTGETRQKIEFEFDLPEIPMQFA